MRVVMISTPYSASDFWEKVSNMKKAMVSIRESVAVIARNEAGEVLLLRRPDVDAHAGWSLPGGRIESHLGETVSAAAVRELREETGLACTLVTVRPWTCEVVVGRDGHRWDVHVVLADVRRHEVALCAEHVEARWTTVDAAITMVGLAPDVTRAALSWYRSRCVLLGELETRSRLPAEGE